MLIGGLSMKVGVVDLFCGVGGLSYGLLKSGIEVAGGIDADASCKYAFEENNNSTFTHKNIEDVKGTEIKRMLRGYDVKVLVGCAPCQPFSNHIKDKKDRSSHKDWSLLYHFARIIEESKPHVISMENVPALEREQVFTDFVTALEKQGYLVNYNIVNAADYGVPQRRRRMVLIAAKKWKFPKGISLISKTHEGNWKTVRNAIESLPKTTAGGICTTDRMHLSSNLSEANLKRIRASTSGGTWRDWPQELVLDCHKSSTGITYSSVYGRMCWDDVSPTITTQFIGYGTGRFGHPEQDRAISIREGALLQSFPIDYVFLPDDEDLSLKSLAKHIGNAVPPKLGKAIGKSILGCIKSTTNSREANNVER